MFQHIHELQDELRQTVEEKKELNRRVNELTKIRQNLKDKIQQMEKQQEILLKNTNGHKVSELLGYVEKQRNVYRTNIKQLLNKLDPDGRTLSELEKEEMEIHVDKGPSSMKNVQMKPQKVEITRLNKAYDENNYAELEQLKQEKQVLETKFKVENQGLQLKINELEDKLAKAQHEMESMEQKLQRALSSVRNEQHNKNETYQENVSSFQTEIQTLNADLKQKEQFLRELAHDKDLLHQQLDDKTEAMEELKKKLLTVEHQRITVENDASGNLRRISDCLSQIKELEQKCALFQEKNEKLQTRILGKFSFKHLFTFLRCKISCLFTFLRLKICCLFTFLNFNVSYLFTKHFKFSCLFTC